jgi:hypothetical protein
MYYLRWQRHGAPASAFVGLLQWKVHEYFVLNRNYFAGPVDAIDIAGIHCLQPAQDEDTF